jgi:hypothetical protein
VAFLTTLVVEYLAKPRLEARKERITRSRRQVDEVVHGFQMAGFLVGSLATLPDVSEERWRPYVKFRLEQLEKTLSALEVDISRLSIRYVAQHSSHIRKTSSFVGYFHGVVLRSIQAAQPDLEGVVEVGDQMEHFDVYFRVYLGLSDSQEPLIKRLFWRGVERDPYSEQASRALRELGLTSSRDLAET